MKREKYDLTDEEFAFFANHVTGSLDSRAIKHIIVGGVAVQAHMLDGLCKRDKCTVEDLVLRDDMRLQDYIRSTDDIDISCDLPGRGEDLAQDSRLILGFLDALPGEYISPSQNHILKYAFNRRGIKKPKFSVEKDGVSSEDDVIMMNIGRTSADLQRLHPSLYEVFLQEGQRLHIPYGPHFNVELQVIKPEHLIATKISNFRPKDVMDIENLVQLAKQGAVGINHEEVQRILSGYPELESNLEKYLVLVK